MRLCRFRYRVEKFDLSIKLIQRKIGVRVNVCRTVSKAVTAIVDHRTKGDERPRYPSAKGVLRELSNHPHNQEAEEVGTIQKLKELEGYRRN